MQAIRFGLAGVFLFGAMAQAATTTVEIAGFAFNGKDITINLGDSVRWVNKDPVSHTTTREDLPEVWDSTALSSGQAFSRAFNAPGTFQYRCSFHPGMTGSITVRDAEASRINLGESIVKTVVPLRLRLAGKNLDQVYLGSYIVNAQAACADCHSCPTYRPGRNPYLGERKVFNTASYLAGGVEFAGGAIVSRNLTPVRGRPAGLGLAAFKRLLRTGHDPDAPGSLLQVMPWPIYGMMSDHDLDAVYAYLSSIPAAATPETHCAAPGQ